MVFADETFSANLNDPDSNAYKELEIIGLDTVRHWWGGGEGTGYRSEVKSAGCGSRG